jgi:hypothetical protein
MSRLAPAWMAGKRQICYIRYMNSSVKKILEQVESWPREDQDELAELAREIEARRTGVYVVDAEEEAAIREGLTQLNRGDSMSEEDMKVFWKRCGVL